MRGRRRLPSPTGQSFEPSTSGIVVAVTLNIAHANTSSLALRVAHGFAQQRR
jgi:hypothetical protein